MKIKKITVLCLLAANCLMVSAQKWFTPDVEKQVNILFAQGNQPPILFYVLLRGGCSHVESAQPESPSSNEQ